MKSEAPKTFVTATAGTHRWEETRMQIARLMLAICVSALVAPPARAQTYPTKPIKVLVGYSPGGAVDIVARTVGQKLSSSIGQPVIVENKPGAGTNIAVRALIESPPDGYTLMLSANALAANASLYQPPPFDPEKDVAPVAQVGRVPVVIATSAGSPYATLGAMVTAAKKTQIHYATPGNGSTPHLAVELFARAAGISLVHVPYRGGSQAIVDVIGGQLPLVAVNALEVLPHVKAGKLRVLAVMSPARTAIMPEVPTIAESGYPGFEASVWYGFIAPAATPKPVIARLQQEVQKAIASPEVRERMASVGGEVTPGTSEQFGALIHSERVRYEKLIREANLRPD